MVPESGGNMAQKDLPSPLITHLSWGRMTVDGIGHGKDFKLWPGGGRAWDWNETNTHHYPGIQPADIEELLEHGAKEIVLSRGMLLALYICPETTELLQRENITTHIAATNKAGEIYNQKIEEGKLIGGLFHSTC